MKQGLATILLLLLASAVSAQWLTHPTPGIPRTADGKPNLSAPAPQTPDGKPDLSGLWHAGAKYESDFKPSDAQTWAQTKSRERDANPAADSWGILCLPPGPMIMFSGPLKIIQTSRAITVLYEVPNNFRQIFTDGRTLPKDPNPTWQGYSVGRWDGETFVAETSGLNEKSWVGRPGYPHTEALRVTERYRRRDIGHIDVQMTFDDPKTFSRPWTISTELLFDADTEMLEFVCNENEKDRQHFVQPSATSSTESRIDPAILAKYVGVYQVPTPRGQTNATITVQGDQLMADVPGRGSGRMVPQSATHFSFAGATIEFVTNETGEVPYFIVHVVEGDFKAPRIDGPKP
jgi:uncharacterized protein DUF3471